MPAEVLLYGENCGEPTGRTESRQASALTLIGGSGHGRHVGGDLAAALGHPLAARLWRWLAPPEAAFGAALGSGSPVYYQPALTLLPRKLLLGARDMAITAPPDHALPSTEGRKWPPEPPRRPIAATTIYGRVAGRQRGTACHEAAADRGARCTLPGRCSVRRAPPAVARKPTIVGWEPMQGSMTTGNPQGYPNPGQPNGEYGSREEIAAASRAYKNFLRFGTYCTAVTLPAIRPTALVFSLRMRAFVPYQPGMQP